MLYQYTRSEKQEDPSDPWLPSPFETPHRIEVLAVQNLPRNWSVSLRFRASSGYPRLPDLDGPAHWRHPPERAPGDAPGAA